MLKFNINTLEGSRIKKSKSLDYLNRTAAAQSIAEVSKISQFKNSLNSTVDTSKMGLGRDSVKEENSA